MKEYFVLFKGRQSVLCSWHENEPDLYGRKVHYIGVTNGLGGYREMINNGWIDRRFNKSVIMETKTMRYIEDKIINGEWKRN